MLYIVVLTGNIIVRDTNSDYKYVNVNEQLNAMKRVSGAGSTMDTTLFSPHGYVYCCGRLNTRFNALLRHLVKMCSKLHRCPITVADRVLVGELVASYWGYCMQQQECVGEDTIHTAQMETAEPAVGSYNCMYAHASVTNTHMLCAFCRQWRARRRLPYLLQNRCNNN